MAPILKAEKAAQLCHSDSSLIARLQARDQSALGEIYGQFSKMTFSVVLRVVRDRGMAEDVMQEVFLRVWTRAGTIDPGLSLGPWIHAIARNRAVDHMRACRSRLTCTTDEAHKAPDVRSAADFERIVALTGRVEPLLAGLGGLPEDQRVAIELAYFDGLSQSEIAKKMGRPLGTVKTWVRTGLRTLRSHIEPVVLATA